MTSSDDELKLYCFRLKPGSGNFGVAYAVAYSITEAQRLLLQKYCSADTGISIHDFALYEITKVDHPFVVGYVK